MKILNEKALTTKDQILFDEFSLSNDEMTLFSLSLNKNCPEKILEFLSDSKFEMVRMGAYRNKRTSLETKQKLEKEFKKNGE